MVMRHAKSSWDDPQLDDHDRPLNSRGLRDAPRMAAWLLEQGRRPDSITSSTAVRAATTAHLIAERLGPEIPIRIVPDLYHADLTAWRRVIRRLPAESSCALCVGHNPGIETLFQSLTGVGEDVPTAAICIFELPVADWRSFDVQNTLKSWALWRPKDLPPEPGDDSQPD
jgi:phosphohistidine phosphatase